MNAKVVKPTKVKELSERDLLAVAGGKKISLAQAQATPGYAIGPDIPTY